MAKLTSDILFKGSLKDISAYTMKGADGIILRTKGGASKEKIKTAPQFAMTRLNCAEFSGCVIAGKQLHRALLSLKHLSDYNFAPHLNGAVRKLQQLDTVQELGKRSILLSLYGSMLEGFDLNKKHRLGDIIKPAVACVLNRHNGSAEMHLPALMQGLNCNIPWTNPLFRIVGTIAAVKDVTYGSNGYSGNEAAGTVYARPVATPWYKTGQAMPAQLLQLQLTTAPDETEAILVTIGIEMGLPGNDGNIRTDREKGCARIIKVG